MYIDQFGEFVGGYWGLKGSAPPLSQIRPLPLLSPPFQRKKVNKPPFPSLINDRLCEHVD